MHQQFWGYKVEQKLYLGVREQKRFNTAGLGLLHSPVSLGETQLHSQSYHPDHKDGDCTFMENSNINV
jgi:hypothetical protein